MAEFKSDYNFEEWFEFVKNKVFLVRLFRRIGDWTPYELEVKDPKQSHFEQGNEIFHPCKIEQFIELPDGDVLLGIRYLLPDTMEEDNFIDYKKLSEIALVMPDDNYGVELKEKEE